MTSQLLKPETSSTEEELQKIPGLYRGEDHSLEAIAQRLEQLQKPSWDHEEIFGKFCNLSIYIDCPLPKVLSYVSKVSSLEEWTISTRRLRPWQGELYKGIDTLGSSHESGSDIYVRFENNLEAGLIDMLCAWDQGEELWTRYYFRFVDAMPTLRKPGTIGFWTNVYHPYYDRSVEDVPAYIREARQKTPWVGDWWPYFYVGHSIEFNNMKLILEHRHRQGS